jgi:hypothetical protein
MPGKVNPVIPEVVTSIAYQLAGFDTTVTMAAELSSLELNPVECIIVDDELQGVSLLEKGSRLLAARRVKREYRGGFALSFAPFYRRR